MLRSSSFVSAGSIGNERVVLNKRTAPKWLGRRRIECSAHKREHDNQADITRRSGLVLGGLTVGGALLGQQDEQSVASNVDVTVTDKVFFEVGLCPTPLRADRALGDKSALCFEPAPLGRITIGLYGQLVPNTVSNFLKTVQAGGYTGTVFHKVLPGQYLMAGRQGSKRMGEVEQPIDLESNPEITSSKAFVLGHTRPGTVSLSVGENDDDAIYRDRAGYHNTEFLITTGPGPANQLDDRNLVFGSVLDGFDTLLIMTDVPTFNPNERVRALNSIASFVGDERAARARRSWGKPLKAIVITDAGVL